MYPAACLKVGGTDAKRGAAGAQRGRSRGVGSDLASPEPTSRTWETDVGEELRDGASRSPRHCAPAPPPRAALRSYARRRMGSGVHEPTKRSRRCCGVAVGTNKETPRSGRGGGAMRHRRRALVGVSPRARGWQAEPKPIAASPSGLAPRWRRRLGFFSGALGRAFGKRTEERETPGRSAGSDGPPPSFPRRYLPGRTERRVIAAS